MDAADRRMSSESDSVKIEYLCRSIRSIEDTLQVLSTINAQLERQKLQDEHFKENQARLQTDINRLYDKFEEHEKDDRKSFEILADKLQKIDARPGKIALNRWERIGIAITVVIILALGSSWIQLQKLSIQKSIIQERIKE